MKIETYIDSLVSYAMNTGLADPLDHQVLTNRLLDILRKDDYEPSNETQSEDLEEILAGILDYAVAKGICDDGITAKDIFDTRIMGAITPMPREVINTSGKSMPCLRLMLLTGIINSPVTPTTSAVIASRRICAGSIRANMARWISPSI